LVKIKSMNKFKLSATSKQRLSGVDIRAIDIVELALTISPIDFGIAEFGGLRTISDQQELFKKGLSKCDGIKNVSKHQSGLAFDIFAYKDNKASWDKYDLTLCATAILQTASQLGYKLEWGGLWHSWQDLPHFQLSD